MQEKLNKTEKFYNREKKKKYRNCAIQTNMDRSQSRRKSKDNAFLRQKTHTTSINKF